MSFAAGAALEVDPKMGQVVMEKNVDGRLEVFRVNSVGELQHRWQKEPSGEWSPWWGLGGSFLPGLAVAKRADGQLQVFAVDKTSYTLSCIRQSVPNGPGWTSWINLRGRVNAPVAVGQNLDGQLEVFGVDPDSGEARHIWQTNLDDDWSAWTTLGGAVEVGLAVGRNRDGRLELFGVDLKSEHLVHCSQGSANGVGNWGEWSSLGGTIFPSPVVGQNPDGRLEVFAVNTRSNAVDHIYQLNSTNGVQWSLWSSLGGRVKQGIAVGKNADGHLEVIAIEREGTTDFSHCWQMQAGSSSDWAAFCGMVGSVEPYPAVGRNQDGSLIIVGRDVNRPSQFDYKRQISANIDWLDCFSMDHLTFPYTARSWQTDDGLPHTAVQAIAQTLDGYLWVGTRNGLARFDGVHFISFDVKSTPQLQNPSITTLCPDHRGALWIGTEGGGVACFKDGIFTHYGQSNGLAGDNLHVIYESRDGCIWFGTTTGMSRYKDHKFTTFTKADGLLSDVVRSFFDDGRGNLWIGTAAGLNRITDGTMSAFSKTNGLPDNSIRGITRDKGGRLWVGSDSGMIWHNDAGQFYAYDSRYGLSDSIVNAICEDREDNLWVGTYSGLYRFREGRFFNEHNNEGASYDKVNALFEDHDGNLWVGSREGLIRLTPKRFGSYDTRQGLTYNNTTSVMEDRNGGLWIGTLGGGLNHLRDEGITALTVNDGLSKNQVLATCEARDGTIWIGTDAEGELNALKNGIITHYTASNGLVNGVVRAIHEDRTGRLWVGTSRGLSCFKDDKFTNYTRNEKLPNEDITAICEDLNGRLWFGTGGGLSLWDNGHFTTYTTRDGLSDNAILSLYEDKAQTLWIGTARGGIDRRRGGHFKTYTMQQGLFSDEILEILEDDDGWLWMSCSQGIFRVRKSDFDAFDEGRIDVISSIAYGTADGMESTLCNGLAQPAGCKTHDGKLWFPTTKGLVIVDPSHIKINEIPPPVFIEKVLADKQPMLQGFRTPMDSQKSLIVSPGRGEVEFYFTALAFQKPEKNRFKYMLEGVDEQWVEGDSRRVAHYLNLHPGHYRFRVIACNSDAVWNTSGASLAIELLPHFWQTFWFRGFVALALVAGVGGTARAITKRRMQHRYELAERERAIEQERARIAKDIHDDLGSSLTHIMMLGNRVKKSLNGNTEAGEHAHKIVTSARATVQSLDEIVWAVNPENDTLDSLIGYIGQYADHFFEGTNVRCRRELPMASFPSVLPTEIRHNLFLVIKEALNNVLKHAGASEVRLGITVFDSGLSVVIEDNGCGFDVSTMMAGRDGNGLKNMRKRVEDLGGTLSMVSEPGKGTKLVLKTRLQTK